MDVNLTIAAVANASTLTFNWTFQYNETWTFHRGACIASSALRGSCRQQLYLYAAISTFVEDRSNRAYFSSTSPLALPGRIALGAFERCTPTSCHGRGNPSQHGQQNFVVNSTDVFSIPGGMRASHRYAYFVHLTLYVDVYSYAYRASVQGTHLEAAFRPLVGGASCFDLRSITWS
jgi:hypothetical protein